MSDQDYSSRILLLLKNDATNLFYRLKERQSEIVTLFALKRTRDHFAPIFQSRYDTALLSDLKYCREEVIIELDQFYNEVEKLKWYLNHTEDMPVAVQDHLARSVHQLGVAYQNLISLVDEDLSEFSA